MSVFQFEFHKKPGNPRLSAGWFEVLIDGQSISGGHCLDREVLLKTFEGSGDYWVLTCGCGVPECAGLYAPFHVTHLEDGLIHWHIEYPEPEREFYFSKGQAVQALMKGLRAGGHVGWSKAHCPQIVLDSRMFSTSAFQSLKLTVSLKCFATR